MPPPTERLGRRLAQVEVDLRQMQRQGVGLGYSSFDGGSIQQNTSDGTPGSVFGTQYDSTNGLAVLNGPPPPTPSAPTGTGTIGAVTVRWDGTWAAGGTTVAPLDYSGVEVHLSETPDFSALLFDTLKGNLTSARGGELFIAVPPGTYYARLVARTTAGRASAPSAASAPLESRPVVREDLGFDIDMLAGNSIFRGDNQPTVHADGTPLLYGDLWLQTPDNVAYQWSPPDPGSWLKVQDQNIVKAINDAADAAGLAQSAGLTASQAHDLATAASNAAARASSDAQAAMDAAQLAQQSGGTGINVYRQTSAPTGGTYHINDLWLDTAHNNQLFAWSGSAWLASDDQRIATALTNASSAQAVAGAKTTLYAQISAPATTGRVMGDTWIDTDDGNRVYVWNGNAWTVTQFGAAALNATARQLGAITIYRQTSAPATGVLEGDYWIDSSAAGGNKAYVRTGGAWVLVQDVAIQSALTNAATAQATADGKARIFYQTSAPTGLLSTDNGDEWVDTDDAYVTYTWSGTAWVKNAISTSSFQPNSLIASTVVATGSITAALLEAILVLATTIVAGNVNGTHAKMTPDGFHVFRADPAGGAPTEVIRLGVASTNDYFTIVNAAGTLAASVDDTGAAHFTGATIDSWPVIAGTSLGDALAVIPGVGGGQAASGSQHWWGSAGPGAGVGNVTTEVGLFEMPVYMTAGRMYKLTPDVTYNLANTTAQLDLRIRDGGTSSPTLTSTQVYYRQFSAPVVGYDVGASEYGLYSPTTSGMHRLLLTAAAGGTGNVNIKANVLPLPDPTLLVEDMGPAKPFTNSIINRGGGGASAPPPAPQQQFVELAPNTVASYRGNNTIRTDTGDVVQGWDPSGNNGDGHGFWTFPVPAITGTIDRVDFYVYTNLTYFNSGGTAIWNLIQAGDGSNINALKMRNDLFMPGYPRPGGKTITLPADWFPAFKSNAAPRAVGISAGKSGGSNETYYCRFDGPSARLRIWFTQ